MSTEQKQHQHAGNVGAKIDMKRGRDVCLYRTFEDAGGTRDFTLYLSRDEAVRLADCLDALLDEVGE